MTEREQTPIPATAPSDTAIRELAEAAGLTIAGERLPDVAAKLSELFAQLSQLDKLDLANILPESSFDPSWENQA